ncbi:hypothetical protein C0W59_02460 [Photobacterium kishitanii]|uniref:DnaJ domain-containing protein n=1 Tax=Photobacterium kishitanii TaxID=318456 RepID=UPI000D16FD59|nr:DnaJ domain-containing protein [Photobacterium kishitanii]PSV18121.1 hypothetical protein C0W59_02460 [Photobacterium kishitanii]
MTTFHELLGTDDRCSKAEIKKKYRQLSVKLHPDKGGSQALMQMLSMAYQQVSKGNGNKKCSDIMIVNDNDREEGRQQVADLNKKISLLIKEKNQLQALIERYQQQASDAYNAGENQAQQTLVLLQTTNKRLNEQLLLLRRQIEENEINPSSSNKRLNKQFAVMIFSVLIIVVIFLGWFIWHYQSQHIQPQPLDLRPTPVTVQVKNVIATQATTMENIDVISGADKIMMTDTVGLWQQRYYEGTRQPYIAVRSLNGSYIVKDCQGTFSYYSNRSHNMARVPANLIFSANDRQFSVYRIPYGNGSSDQQWLNSQSLSINNNIFSNNGYKSSSLALAAVCNNTGPF